MGYDVFLSHSHVDAEWTRELHDRLATTDYNGRMLRAWLDQEVLDPGELSSSRELDSALDRSRFLALVLTAESVASDWVRHEIDYFIGKRRPQDVVLIRRRPCHRPAGLETATLIEWSDGVDAATERQQLLEFIRPGMRDQIDDYNHGRSIRRAWEAARWAQPEGLDGAPTKENSELLDALLAYDISNPDDEGPALAGFQRVGQLVGEIDSTALYEVKMVLGELLAVAILRNPAYGRAAAEYVRQDMTAQTKPSFLTVRNRALRGAAGPPAHTNLLLAVARSSSKLAEIDPSLIDLSTMTAVLYELDRRGDLAGYETSVAMMIGRTLAKLRGTPLIDLLIHTLVEWGGSASHVAAIAAIATHFDSGDSLVYLTKELAALAPSPQAGKAMPPPSPSTVRLLLDPLSILGTDQSLRDEVARSRDEFVESFGSNWPLGTGLWPALRYAPVPRTLVNGPLVGTVRKITLANMEADADTLGPTDVACLTEPRIVDALLDGVGGYLIDDDQANAPLGQRLRGRRARFATFDRSRLDVFEDGSAVALWPKTDGRGAWGYAASPEGQ